MTYVSMSGLTKEIFKDKMKNEHIRKYTPIQIVNTANSLYYHGKK